MFALFERTYEAKYPKATECLAKDRAELLTFYDFPAEHWMHLRTTNPIESVFATVRLRTEKTKGSGTSDACLSMVFKLMGECLKQLANVERIIPPPGRDLRSHIRRRDRGKERRLNQTSSTTFDNSSGYEGGLDWAGWP